MGAFIGCCASSSETTAAALGVNLAFASPAGTIAAAPAGFGNNIGRLRVTLPSGNATWSSLTGGTNGQLLDIRNEDATNSLTLPASSWGGIGDLVLPPGNNVLAYYDSTLTSWRLTAP